MGKGEKMYTQSPNCFSLTGSFDDFFHACLGVFEAENPLVNESSWEEMAANAPGQSKLQEEGKRTANGNGWSTLLGTEWRSVCEDLAWHLAHSCDVSLCHDRWCWKMGLISR